ncbi:MAG: hypothetical protein EPN30_04610 [Actinomycetota bacterium]|nr:MAG: hypothetical protein EPN30_04610 [Actinomycetota bacterium]
MVEDRLSTAVEAAAMLGPSASSAPAALHEFFDGRSVTRLSSILVMTHSGAARLVDSLGFECCPERVGLQDGRSVSVVSTRGGRVAWRRGYFSLCGSAGHNVDHGDLRPCRGTLLPHQRPTAKLGSWLKPSSPLKGSLRSSRTIQAATSALCGKFPPAGWVTSINTSTDGKMLKMPLTRLQRNMPMIQWCFRFASLIGSARTLPARGTPS